LLETIQDNLERLDNWVARRLPLDLRGFSNRINARVESQVQARWQVKLLICFGTLSD